MFQWSLCFENIDKIYFIKNLLWPLMNMQKWFCKNVHASSTSSLQSMTGKQKITCNTT